MKQRFFFGGGMDSTPIRRVELSKTQASNDFHMFLRTNRVSKDLADSWAILDCFR